jgi:3-hydroxyacyl-CoA dehydrogenase/3a,7a,12a-trihydroxy-5b-cholest-24-enoyl-CoA hydratase
VAEIRAAGGQAVPNYDSVEDGHKLVQTALDNYGRLDILINNAGILRDRSFAKLTESDWDLVHRVHLRAAFRTTQAAWPVMRANSYGRIIMTSSVAGIFGNFGQANYSAAKLGLVGLANTLAAEGERAGIHCNVIVPMAASRLTRDILPPDVFDSLAPEHIAPVVAWLCHEDCTDNGLIIEAAGGWAGRYRWERGLGCVLLENTTGGQPAVRLECVRDRWPRVLDMEATERPATNQEATMDVVAKIQSAIEELGQVSSSPSFQEVGPRAAVGFTSQPFEFSYNFKDAILYALGLGVSTQDQNGLRYLYEGHEQFAVLPTFGVIPAFGGLEALVTGRVPGLELDLSRVLHGEQYMEVCAPRLPTSARLTSVFRVQDVLDKGPAGMVVLVEVESRDEKGSLIMRNQLSIFVVGGGGWGGPRDSPHLVPVAVPPSPGRRADKTASFRTTADQAALYRLSGDLNPLHIDPGFAALGGFDRPILHGLCTFGIASRLIVHLWCDDNPERLRAVKARFSRPVLPGQTVVVDTWREGDRILFTCTVEETGKSCLTGGWARVGPAGSDSKL